MALFHSKQDKDKVRLLTQMAQIDTENEQELREFAARWAIMEEPETPENMAQMCDIVHRTMVGLAIERAIPADCIVWINSRNKTIIRNLEINDSLPQYLDGETVAVHGKQLLPLVDLEWKRFSFTKHKNIQYIVRNELTEMINQFGQAMGKEEILPVRLCKECKNPMLVIGTPTQLFCSHRCGNRARTRAQRAVEKISKNNIVASHKGHKPGIMTAERMI